MDQAASTSKPQSSSRRGRLPAGERESRRQEVLTAALAEVTEKGYEEATMLGIATRAGASKETLYSWFGSKTGLFDELIRFEGETTLVRVRQALAGGGEPETILIEFSTNLLRLLTSDWSVAINRAAMSSPELAGALLASGRHSVGPVAVQYLDRLVEQGWLAIDDTEEAFRLLYGLVIQDTQIRVLLGEPAPGPAELAEQARQGVAHFLLAFSTS